MDVLNASLYIIRKLEKELPPELTYHSFRHTIDVVRFSELLALAEGVTGEDFEIIQTAAAYHDSGFLVQYDRNEPNGCDIARKKLPDFGYNDSQIERVCKIIMATQVPQKPEDLLCQIVCDADLDYLGTPDFYFQGNMLRKELAVNNVTYTDNAWIQLEIDFLKQHEYFTSASKMLRDKTKARFIEELKTKLKEF